MTYWESCSDFHQLKDSEKSHFKCVTFELFVLISGASSAFLEREHGNDGLHLLNNDFRHSSCTLMISFNPHRSSVNEALLSVFPVYGGERQSLARLDKSFKWKSVLNLEWSNAVFTASPRLNCSYGIWPRLWCGLPYTAGFRSTLLLQLHAHLPAIPSGYLKFQIPFNLRKWKESNSCRMCFATMNDY